MSSNTSFNAFSKDAILKAVNAELKVSGSRTKAAYVQKVGGDLNNQVLLKTTRGATLVAKLWCPGNAYTVMGIRGIHRLIKPSQNYTVMFNGQAGKNLSPLVFNGENGTLYYAGKKDCEELMKSITPDIKPEWIQERLQWEAKANPIIEKELETT